MTTGRILGVNGIRLLGLRTGVGRAIEAILKCMGRVEHPFSEVRVYTPKPLDNSIELPTCAHNVVLDSGLPYGVWEQVTLPRAHGPKHLLFCPSYVVPMFARCPTLLVHHGSYEGYPQAFPLHLRIKARVINQLSARAATLISTVSEHSKRDIIRFYGVRPEKIHVIREGVDTQLFHPVCDVERAAAWRRANLGEDVPFLLYVGKPTKRRNLPSLIEAFAELKASRHLPHKLVLIGTSLPGSPFESIIDKTRTRENVVSIPFVTHQDLVMAYNACEMLVYPSSYEGFGMPVLEAMACGTPVITLDKTAFPEFAGGVALLLPDAKPGTLRDGICSLHQDREWRHRMSVEGPIRAAKYDWHAITSDYVDLMVRLAPD